MEKFLSYQIVHFARLSDHVLSHSQHGGCVGEHESHVGGRDPRRAVQVQTNAQQSDRYLEQGHDAVYDDPQPATGCHEQEPEASVNVQQSHLTKGLMLLETKFIFSSRRF